MSMQIQVPEGFADEPSLAAAAGPGERSQTVPCARSVPRVLVVENDEALRNLIADVFAFEGYFVTEADGEESLLRSVGLANTGEEPFDLVVLGLQAKNALDLDVLTRLRRAGCQTPAIVLGARTKAPLTSELNERDALFLGKPFALENLRVLANHVVHARQCGFGTRVTGID